MKEELLSIIRQGAIKTVFQPIISLRDGETLGFEALSRISVDSKISNISELFALAEAYKLVWELEQLCRIKALESLKQEIGDGECPRVFINVNPCVLEDPNFQVGFTKEHLSRHGIKQHNIIIEITEKSTICNMDAYNSIVSHYKDQGYRIAVDDAGTGHSGLVLISRINPHFIKIDMDLIRGIDKDKLKYAVVKGLVELSRLSNIQLIGEGIETREELDTLINLGVQYGQGYFLQRPVGAIVSPSQQVIAQIHESNRRKNHIYGDSLENIYVTNITKKGISVSPTTKIGKVLAIFQSDPAFLSISVVNNNTLLGVVNRARFLAKLSGQYGFSLYQSKPIYTLMENNFTSVDVSTPINAVSQIAMARDDDNIYDPVFVSDKTLYAGFVTIKDLLVMTTQIELKDAKNQNPLTGLPGNNMIQNQIAAVIKNNTDFSILYIDIDNFKAYNDRYGFEKGDQIIKELANILMDVSGEHGFVGHIGGDDFIVILAVNDFIGTVNQIVDSFRRRAKYFYTSEDAKRGFIIGKNRNGEIEQFPLVSLSIAAVSNMKKSFATVTQVSERLTYLKHVCKMKKGNCCYYE